MPEKFLILLVSSNAATFRFAIILGLCAVLILVSGFSAPNITPLIQTLK